MNKTSTELQEFRKAWIELLKLATLKTHEKYREKILLKANKYEKAIADLEAYEKNPSFTLGVEIEELRIKHIETIENNKKLQNDMRKLNDLFVGYEEAEQNGFKV